MKRRSASKSIVLQRRYLAALEKHLARGPRASLREAGSLGRQAVAAGLVPSYLAKIHGEALITLISPNNSTRTNDVKIAHAGAFFIEALTAIVDTRLPLVARGGRLNRLNRVMHKRTAELAATKLQLRRELALRKTLEASLKKSGHHHDQLLERSRRMQAHLRRLSHEILSVQEQERKKISIDLHEEIGQNLTAINVKLATLKKGANGSAKSLKGAITDTQRLVEESINTVHRFARELRPPILDDLGIIPALHAHMKAFTKRTGVPVRFRTFAAVETLDSDKRTVLYRVAQAAFSNISRHAQASLVNVRIRRVSGSVCMEIHDNGRSFDTKRLLVPKTVGRLGLLGMRERVEMVGGSFGVESKPGQGTTISVQIPFGGQA